MKQAVVCIAPDVSEAEKEVTTLREAGFTTDDISVLWPDLAGAQELGYEQHTKAPEGAAWGVFFGAIVGAILSFLNVNGYIWSPWTFDLLKAGPVMSVMSGMAIGGTAGFLLGLLFGLAFPEYEARKYERKIKIGSTLLAVHTDTASERKTAEKALKTTNAFGIHRIEEVERCQPKSTCGKESDLVNTGTALLLICLASAAITAALADTPASTSPKTKAEEQKAKMPADVTTKSVPKAIDQDKSDKSQSQAASLNTDKSMGKAASGAETKKSKKLDSKAK